MKKVSLILILITALASFSLNGCGKASNPEPIKGSGYPHRYPAQ